MLFEWNTESIIIFINRYSLSIHLCNLFKYTSMDVSQYIFLSVHLEVMKFVWFYAHCGIHHTNQHMRSSSCWTLYIAIHSNKNNLHPNPSILLVIPYNKVLSYKNAINKVSLLIFIYLNHQIFVFTITYMKSWLIIS